MSRPDAYEQGSYRIGDPLPGRKRVLELLADGIGFARGGRLSRFG